MAIISTCQTKRGSKLNFKNAIRSRLDGRSERWLALKTGIQPSQLNRMIRGEYRWNTDHLESVAKVLSVPVWKLVKEAEKGE